MSLLGRLHDERIVHEFIENFLRHYVFQGQRTPTAGEYLMLLDACEKLVSELLGDEFETFYNESYR